MSLRGGQCPTWQSVPRVILSDRRESKDLRITITAEQQFYAVCHTFSPTRKYAKSRREPDPWFSDFLGGLRGKRIRFSFSGFSSAYPVAVMRRMSSATVRLRPSPTAATRSGRCIRHRRRSHRSPLGIPPGRLSCTELKTERLLQLDKLKFEVLMQKRSGSAAPFIFSVFGHPIDPTAGLPA